MNLFALSRHVLSCVALALVAVACGRSETVPDPASEPSLLSIGAMQLDGPYQHEDLQVWLLRGPDRLPQGPPIVPLEQAIADGIAVVYETSNVNELTIENKSPDLQVWVQAGDVVQGGKQDRTIAIDLALAPNSGQVPIASFCVERGRWAARGLQTGHSVQALQTLQTQSEGSHSLQGSLSGVRINLSEGSTLAFSSSSNNVSSLAIKKAVLVEGQQGSVWARVGSVQRGLRLATAAQVVDSNNPTSLEMTLSSETAGQARKPYCEALADLADKHDDLVGCVFVVQGELDSAEVYASHDLFRKLWPKLLRGAANASIAAGAAGDVESKPAPDAAAVLAFLAEADEDWQRTGSDESPTEMRLSGNALSHIVESRTGSSGWLHRCYLRK